MLPENVPEHMRLFKIARWKAYELQLTVSASSGVVRAGKPSRQNIENF